MTTTFVKNNVIVVLLIFFALVVIVSRRFGQGNSLNIHLHSDNNAKKPLWSTKALACSSSRKTVSHMELSEWVKGWRREFKKIFCFFKLCHSVCLSLSVVSLSVGLSVCLYVSLSLFRCLPQNSSHIKRNVDNLGLKQLSEFSFMSNKMISIPTLLLLSHVIFNNRVMPRKSLFGFVVLLVSWLVGFCSCRFSLISVALYLRVELLGQRMDMLQAWRTYTQSRAPPHASGSWSLGMMFLVLQPQQEFSIWSWWSCGMTAWCGN